MSTAKVASQVVGVGAQPDRHGLVPSDQTAHPGLARFLSTSAGAADGTTIISTALTGATADVYVGQLVMCVGPYTSANFGLIRRVLIFDPATDKLTVGVAAEGSNLPVQTAINDAWEGFDDPSSIVVENTGGGGAGALDDATRDEAANFWATGTGDHAVVAAGSIAEATARPVASFATPTMTVSPVFGSVPAIGDLFDVMALPLWEGNPEFDRGYAEIPVDAQRGGAEAFDEDPHLIRIPRWTGRCAVNFKGSGTGAGDGVQASYAPDLYRILSAMFDAVRSTGEAILGGTVSTVSITNATAAQFPVGSPTLHAGSGSLAIAVSTGAGGGGNDDVNVQPYLDRAPAAGEVLYGGVAWYPKVTGHQAVCFHEWDDAMRWFMYGGVPNIEIDGLGIGQKPMLRFQYQGGPYWGVRKAITSAPQLSSGVVRDTVRPNGLTHARIKMLPTGAAANVADLLCIDFKVNYQVERRAEEFVNSPLGFFATTVTKITPVFTATCKVDRVSPNDTMREVERMLNEGTFTILAQCNQVPGHTVGWYAHQAQWAGGKFKANAGLREIEFSGKVKRSGVSTLSPCALIQA